MKELSIGKIGSPSQPVGAVRPRAEGEEAAGVSFDKLLKDAIAEVNRLQKDSNNEISKLLTGEAKDIHTAMIAVQKADISFQAMMQIRNKIVQAYQEIMRMQF